MKRNAITVTLKELIKLAEEIKDDIEKNKFELDTKFQIPIINKTGELDGWYLEK